MTILCDVDGVIADMLPAWLAHYNMEYGDTVKCDDITDWDVSKFVKPECGKRVFAYLDRPDLYHSVQPLASAWESVAWLRDLGHRVVFLSGCTSGVMTLAKIEWLNDHGFTKGMDDVILCGTNRPSLKAMLSADLMIEDYHKNLDEWGGPGLLFDAPYNRECGKYQRVTTWADAIEALAKHEQAA